MKKPTVDYRNFRLSKINTPEFSHLKYLLGWVGYFIMYLITEKFIPYEKCHVMHCFMDDIIPFNEWFVIPYVFWYFLIAFTLLYFALYNTNNFKSFMIFIIVTQVVAMAIYIAFPNRQDLRPEEFTRDNPLTKLVGLLYAFDTSTNVCPSLHVAYSIGIMSVWLKEKSANVYWKIFIVLVCLLICLSTAFIKQHSVIDACVAVPVCILAEIIAFGKTYWSKRLKSNK